MTKNKLKKKLKKKLTVSEKVNICSIVVNVFLTIFLVYFAIRQYQIDKISNEPFLIVNETLSKKGMIYTDQVLQLENIGGPLRISEHPTVKSFIVLNQYGNNKIKIPLKLYNNSIHRNSSTGVVYEFFTPNNNSLVYELNKKSNHCISGKIENYIEISYSTFENESKVEWFHNNELLSSKPDELKKEFITPIINVEDSERFSINGIKDYLKSEGINFDCDF